MAISRSRAGPERFYPTPMIVKIWRAFAIYSPWFPIGRIVAAGCVTKLAPTQIAAYDAPYPDGRYKAGARAFPRLIPMDESNPALLPNREAWDQLGLWQKPFLTVFGKNDPVLGSADEVLQHHVPGTSGQPHQRIWGGHFIQEDRGDELARIVLAWLGTSFPKDIR